MNIFMHLNTFILFSSRILNKFNLFFLNDFDRIMQEASVCCFRLSLERTQYYPKEGNSLLGLITVFVFKM